LGAHTRLVNHATAIIAGIDSWGERWENCWHSFVLWFLPSALLAAWAKGKLLLAKARRRSFKPGADQPSFPIRLSLNDVFVSFKTLAEMRADEWQRYAKWPRAVWHERHRRMMMRNQSLLLLAAATIGLAVGQASAADLPRKAPAYVPPAPPPMFGPDAISVPTSAAPGRIWK
jgi:hypothetical protein